MLSCTLRNLVLTLKELIASYNQLLYIYLDQDIICWCTEITCIYSKTCVKQPLSKRPEIGFQYILLNAGQKYCRMLPLEHSAIISTFIKLPFVIKIFVLSILEWPFYTGFTVWTAINHLSYCHINRKYKIIWIWNLLVNMESGNYKCVSISIKK